jgi:hypothetical protein
MVGADLKKLGFHNYERILNTASDFSGAIEYRVDQAVDDPRSTTLKYRTVHFQDADPRKPVEFHFTAEKLRENSPLQLVFIQALAQVDPNELHPVTKVYTKDYRITGGKLPTKVEMQIAVEAMVIADRLDMQKRLDEQQTTQSIRSRPKMSW